MSQALYRFYSGTGQLMYVGITKDPPGRIGQHGREKDWWTEVSGISVEWHPDRNTALAAEKRAIQVEHPRYNVQHNSGGPSRRKSEPAGRLRVIPTWRCDVCDNPIQPKRGYIHADQPRAYRAMKADSERPRRPAYPGSSISVPVSETLLEGIEYDVGASWEVHHRACDPNPKRSDYWMGIDQWNTWEGIFDSIAHLITKDWVVDYTNFDDFVRCIPARIGEGR